MPDTERLYAKSDDARAALVALDKAKREALYAIELIADDLRDKTGASLEDAKRLINSADDGLNDMLYDVRSALKEELDEADVTIGRIEERDLYLSRPVL